MTRRARPARRDAPGQLDLPLWEEDTPVEDSGHAAPVRIGTDLSDNPQQAAAIEVRGQSVALYAGAGCGKTSVLTRRLLWLLEDEGVPLDRIVALTFTEKAARELRGRVRQACEARLAVDPVRWQAVLRGLEVARIGTFHAFCGQVLRRFAVEAGLDPGFGILEESLAPSLRERALDAGLRRALARGDENLVAVAVEHGLSGVRETLADTLAGRALGDLQRWAAVAPDALLAIWEEVFRARHIPALLARVGEKAQPVLDALAGVECRHEAMRGRIATLLEIIPTLAACSNPIDALDRLHEAARVQGSQARHWSPEESYARVKEGLDGLRKIIKDVRDDFEPDAGRSLPAAEFGLRYARLAASTWEAYEAAKRSAGLLDFDDLLLKARDLLRDDSIRRRLTESIDVLLVDEFQDTDPIQAEILELLAGTALDGGRLYLVGDTKQSIYRFRGARPQLFGDFSRRFRESGRLRLSTNYRSAPGILGFVNALFVDWYDTPKDALEPQAERAGNLPGVVEFLWAMDPDAPTGPRGPAAGDRRRTEAHWIARLVASRLAEGAWTILDKATNTPRAARQGDIALLFRTLNDAAPYEQALAREGLDYHVVGGSAFFAQQEVIDLMNLVTAIEDPLDPLALAGLLRSPFFAVSDEGLFWLATSSGGDLSRALAKAERIAELSDLDRRRILRARDLLDGWRSVKDRIPISGLLDRALEESGYEAALMGEFLGERKRANVRKLVRLARRFDAEGGFALADFASRLRADFLEDRREGQAATAGEDSPAIRLMTVHQAKGLEFPVVILPDLDRDSGAPPGRFRLDPELGPLVRPSKDDEDAAVRRSLGWLVGEQIEKDEDERESLRLLYVATTRARDVLVLSAGLGAEETGKSPALHRVSSRFDRATGQPLDPSTTGHAPPVRVTITEPDPALGRRPLALFRPKLLRTARLIERAIPAVEVDEKPSGGIPRFLDLDPALGLPPSRARLDHLIRAVLAEPESVEPQGLESVLKRAARRQSPVANSVLIAEARRVLASLLRAPIVRELADAAEVLRGRTWAVAWPPDAQEPTTCRGGLDLAFRRDAGPWTVVALSDRTASPARERLRLALSGLVLTGPVGRWVRLSWGPLAIDEEGPFPDSALASLFADALA